MTPTEQLKFMELGLLGVVALVLLVATIALLVLVLGMYRDQR